MVKSGYFALAFSIACVQGLKGALSFQTIGHLPGQANSSALAVSADGTVVAGGVRGGAVDNYAHLWTESGGFGQLLGGTYSFGPSAIAVDVSADAGFVAGRTRTDPTGQFASFRWSAGGGYEVIPDFPTGIGFSHPQAISGDGGAVVGHSSLDGGGGSIRVPWIWTPLGGTVQLSDPFGDPIQGEARAISAAGDVVAGFSFVEGEGTQAMRWTGTGGAVRLGVLRADDTQSLAYGISPDGGVIVGSSSKFAGTRTSFRWTEAGGMEGLGNLPGGRFGQALAVSTGGSVIVGSDALTSGAQQFATVWDEVNGLRSLTDLLLAQGIDVRDWEVMLAQDVSWDGDVIVGSGTNPDGEQEGWVVSGYRSLIPEPSGAILLAVTILAMAFGRRR